MLWYCLDILRPGSPDGSILPLHFARTIALLGHFDGLACFRRAQSASEAVKDAGGPGRPGSLRQPDAPWPKLGPKAVSPGIAGRPAGVSPAPYLTDKSILMGLKVTPDVCARLAWACKYSSQYLAVWRGSSRWARVCMARATGRLPLTRLNARPTVVTPIGLSTAAKPLTRGRREGFMA